MKRPLLALFSALAFTILTPSLNALTPAEELTAALQEVIQPALESEPLDVSLTIIDYRIVDGQLADFRMEYEAKVPTAKLGGNLLTYYEGLSQSKAPSKLGKGVMLTSHNKLTVSGDDLFKDQPMKPIPKEEWQAHLETLKKNMLVKEDLDITLKALKTNDKEEVESFEAFIHPKDKNKDLLFDIRLTFTIQKGTFTCDVIVENNGRTAKILDSNIEKQVVDFLENIRTHDAATMMMAQSMIHLFKGYAGMLFANLSQ
jgi:hypothetical protein